MIDITPHCCDTLYQSQNVSNKCDFPITRSINWKAPNDCMLELLQPILSMTHIVSITADTSLIIQEKNDPIVFHRGRDVISMKK